MALEVMPVVKEVMKTKKEKALQIAGKTVTVTLDVAKFISKRANNGFIIGSVIGALLSGYAPMSQGYLNFLGHGVVKNWRWLWGATTWMDTLGYEWIHAADIAVMASKMGIAETGLNALTNIVQNVIYKLSTKPEARETTDNMKEIADLHRQAFEALHESSSEGEAPSGRSRRENDVQRRYREFMEQFNKLPSHMRDAYLLEVFTKGMKKKLAKNTRQFRLEDARPRYLDDAHTSATRGRSSVYGLNDVNQHSLPPGSSRDTRAEIKQRVQAARRRRMQNDPNIADPSSSEGPSQQVFRTPSRLVSYGPGLRQSRRGGAQTIQGMAPVLEFNEAADDPYVMRPKVQ